ncbi:HTH-type transcriptional regulator YjdC [Pseudovibrio axinellae]|uniref:HTH-type transcriptional regulator YjdC n=1 Tax=Pseudovibrio axinellae TaxID=989403 RepID=A0A165VRX2_9HYPH|nr:TetR family transcriptional regulator [Pseudovibrio axinellae]KZL15350.1 HTH-type transcriptional regulator YjdC [Pseudovibrio axinellae]SER52968.1 transcriptional regulator, TetR family [Pseudovibrio axinellae]
MRLNKRDEILENAYEIFYRNGFRGTGMDMLVAETGISKTSMYKHFNSKDELILAVLELRQKRFFESFIDHMDELASEPKDKLLAVFDVLAEWFNEKSFKSCMFLKASFEFPEAHHPIHQRAAKHRQLIYRHLFELVEQAGLKNADSVTRQVLMLIEGAIVTAQIGNIPEPAADAKKAAKMVIDAAS